jgi:hypothetical protein
MTNVILAALGLLFALVVGYLMLTSPNPEGLAIAIVGVILAGVGGYYLWLSRHTDQVPEAMRRYPWARTPRGLLWSGLALLGVAGVLVAVGAVYRP